MAHSVTSSTSTWLEGKVQEEKCQELKLNTFFFLKKKGGGGIRAYMIFYANTYTFELYRKADGKFQKGFNKDMRNDPVSTL